MVIIQNGDEISMAALLIRVATPDVFREE